MTDPKDFSRLPVQQNIKLPLPFQKMINIATVYYFNFLKSNTVLKVLFALIPVNKDLEKTSHLREKKLLPGKKYFLEKSM